MEELLKAGKISIHQSDVWQLYCGSELGQKVLMQMMHETFMDEPPPHQFTGVGLGFFDGRRSIFRDITRTIQYVDQQLRGTPHDNGQSETTQRRK